MLISREPEPRGAGDVWGWRGCAGPGRMRSGSWPPKGGGCDGIMLDQPAAEPSDPELLRRIAQRDPAALGELYDRVGGVLFATALHILGDRREAEEVIQDVFLQIWNKAAT